jgi:hypothetical protein
MAPCVQDGLLSLSCCKPQIRSAAQPGDWVIGFLPKRMGRGRVAWAGRVNEVILLGDYQARFPHRHDAIYRKVGVSPEGNEILEPLRDDYHDDALSRMRDRRGRNALLFSRFWYWGRDAVMAPEVIADMAHYFVGQSATGSGPGRAHALERWLRDAAPPGCHGEPRDPRKTKPMDDAGPPRPSPQKARSRPC